MTAQRPPRAAVRAAVRACLADLTPGDRVVVALSGGPDSLALAAASAVVGAELGLLVDALVVDHGLQPGSARAADGAAEQARILGCQRVQVARVQVDRAPGDGGVEAAARAARYRALEACADAAPRAAAILLGHTRDDQAETVLLGLARGSGTRSLAGMAPVSGRCRRPLLNVPREVVQAAAREAAQEDPRLEPWSDPHNIQERFARVRVRTEVLPVLEANLGPGIAAALARTALLARQDADALDQWADEVWGSLRAPERDAPQPGAHDPCGLRGQDAPEPTRIMERAGVAGLPAAIVSRVVRRFLVGAGCRPGDLTAEHVAGVLALLTPERPTRAEVALPGGFRARREQDAVVVRA